MQQIVLTAEERRRMTIEDAMTAETHVRRSRDIPGGARDTADKLTSKQAQHWPLARSIHFDCDHGKHAARILRWKRSKALRGGKGARQ